MYYLTKKINNVCSVKQINKFTSNSYRLPKVDYYYFFFLVINFVTINYENNCGQTLKFVCWSIDKNTYFQNFKLVLFS